MSIEQHVSALQAELEVQQDGLEELRSELSRRTDQCQRLTQAIRVLSKEKPAAKPPPQRKPRRGYSIDGSVAPDRDLKEPDPKQIDRLMAFLTTSSNPQSMSEIATELGLTSPGARPYVDWLRQREMVRFAGRRGMAYLYTTMDPHTSVNGAEVRS